MKDEVLNEFRDNISLTDRVKRLQGKSKKVHWREHDEVCHKKKHSEATNGHRTMRGSNRAHTHSADKQTEPLSWKTRDDSK